jgi:hypothetical protein
MDNIDREDAMLWRSVTKATTVTKPAIAWSGATCLPAPCSSSPASFFGGRALSVLR